MSAALLRCANSCCMLDVKRDETAMKARRKKPKPSYSFKGRPVYTQEQLETFDSRVPNEEGWAKALEKRAAAKTSKANP